MAATSETGAAAATPQSLLSAEEQQPNSFKQQHVQSLYGRVAAELQRHAGSTEGGVVVVSALPALLQAALQVDHVTPQDVEAALAHLGSAPSSPNQQISLDET